MQNKSIDRLLLFSLIFLAYWLFGNLYEQIVMVPNHLVNPIDVLAAYQDYFVLTSPTVYFVPLTQIAVIIVFYLYFKVDDKPQKQLLRRASHFGLLSLGVTLVIVTQINVKLFGSDFFQYEEALRTLSIMWLIGNFVRMFFVGSTLYFVAKTFLLRQTLKVGTYAR